MDADGRVPSYRLQLHEHPSSQDEPLACISTRIWSVPFSQTDGTIRRSHRKHRPRLVYYFFNRTNQISSGLNIARAASL